MIIDFARLKSKLGIDASDTDQDADLEATINEQTAWVEGETHRRFNSPSPVTETITGPGRTTLWLSGHLELNNNDHPEWGTIQVIERIPYADPETLDPATVYDVRGGVSLASLVRTDGYTWGVNAFYDCTYYDGYLVAPLDIQALIFSLTVTSYRLDQSTGDASAGITSESLVGVYSYTIDRQHATLDASGQLSDVSQKTINRWKRGLL